LGRLDGWIDSFLAGLMAQLKVTINKSTDLGDFRDLCPRDPWRGLDIPVKNRKPRDDGRS
jgi:hypothetical protein